jgi:hypothetical protein
MPRVARSDVTRPSSAAWSPECGSSARIVSGPLKPGPKPAASMSYALRVVVPVGLLPWSEEPSRSDSAGIASVAITTTATAASERGCRWRKPDQRAAAPVADSVRGPDAASARRWRRLSTRMPSTPSSAGSSVIAAATVITTVNAAATATPLRKVSRRVNMPSSAMHTVPPANSTARPEVLRATTAASSGLRPRRIARRCRVTMNSA